MKTAIGGAGLAERLFGNTAMKLIRKCPSPVWIAHPEGPPALQRVLAAIDPMPTAERSEQLNRRILESATQMARMGAGHLDILHCWHLPGESTMSFGRTRISPAKLERMRDMAEKVHRRKVVDLVERMRLTGLSVKPHVIHGDPTASVLAFAEQAKSDLIVIGTADKSALAGLLMGSTAENIVEKSRTSVLAIKPEGFVSPIKPR